MKTTVALIVLLLIAIPAAAATLEVTSGFFHAALGAGSFDGTYKFGGAGFTVGQDFSGAANHCCGPDPSLVFGGPGAFTFDGLSSFRATVVMHFTFDAPLTTFSTHILDMPESRAFTMTGSLATCGDFNPFNPCPADAPSFSLVGQGTVTAEWRLFGCCSPENDFFISYDFAPVPEPSTAVMVVLGAVIAALVANRRYR
jgi:PEP-CTERM motif